jgi:hypothetical protein
MEVVSVLVVGVSMVPAPTGSLSRAAVAAAAAATASFALVSSIMGFV